MQLISNIGGLICVFLTLHSHGPVPYSDAHILFLSFICLPVPNLHHDLLHSVPVAYRAYWFFLLFHFGNTVFLTQDLDVKDSKWTQNGGAKSKQELLFPEYFLLKRCLQIVRCIKKVVKSSNSLICSFL